MQISPSGIPHLACTLIHLNLLAKTKLFLVGILFLLFYTSLNLYLVFSGVGGWGGGGGDIMYEDLL